MSEEAINYLHSIVAQGPEDEALQGIVHHLKTHLNRCYAAIALLDRTHPDLDTNGKLQLDIARTACSAMFELLDKQVNEVLIPRLRGKTGSDVADRRESTQ
jgi:hypothetical protein